MISPLLFAMLLQVGPNPDPGSVANTIPRSPRAESIAPLPRVRPAAVVAACPLDGSVDLAEVLELAHKRASRTSGDEAIAALQCAAMAQAELGLWNDAAAGFLKARDRASGKPAWQARIGTQRGHALAETGRIVEARSAFGDAIADATAASDPVLAGQIAADKSVVEVSASDTRAAAATLAAARETSPGDYRLWLLSATLARREDRLSEAQSHIERAADLAPSEPDVGLEAGVIAVLSGRIEAARASFESVVRQPQAGAQAETARGYLAQLDQLAAEPQ